MKTLNARITAILLIFAVFTSGCTPFYVPKIEKAYSRLKIGMTREEINVLFNGCMFLKEQKISRPTAYRNRIYDVLYPEAVLNEVTFDGNTKVFSYLIKKTLEWPNGWDKYYVCIFYNEKEDKVIGWGKIHTMIDVKDWGEKF